MYFHYNVTLFCLKYGADFPLQNKQATSQTPGGAEDWPEKKVNRVQGMFRKSEKQRATARYSVSDFSKLRATCNKVSSMAKLGTKPFGEEKISTK